MSGKTSDREEEHRGEPDGYVRRSTILQVVGAVAGVVGAYVGFSGLFDRLYEYVRAEVRNERVERINSDNRIENKLDQHLLGRR